MAKIDGNMTFERVNNSVQLAMYRNTPNKECAAIRANALFIQAKLCSAGVSAAMAKEAIEKLFNDGRDQGWSEGNEAGYDAGYDAGADSGGRD
jgi:hypothetical protein